MSSLFAFTAPF